MNICFIIDDWDAINPENNSTLRLIHEASLRGHTVAILYPSGLTIRNNITYGFVRLLAPFPKKADKIELFYKKTALKEVLLPITGFDAVCIRKDPPLDNIMLNFLDSVKDEVFIFNDIDGMRKANNKIYTASFHDPKNSYLPITYVSKNKTYLKRVIEESSRDKMILKPINAFGGSGVIILEKKARHNIDSLLDFYINRAGEKSYVIVQEYIEGAEAGDIRVLLLNGQPIGAYKRIPQNGDLRSNLKAGGRAVKYELGPNDLKICEQISEKLVADGLYFVGIDIINEKLIEVNVQSPGGICNINRFNRVKLQKKVLDFVEKKATKKFEYLQKREYLMQQKQEFSAEIRNCTSPKLF